MADIFGQTQVLPSWLQDDSASRAAQGFQIGSQIAATVNNNRQRAVENQRADRRLSLDEQQAQTSKLLTEAQIEGQRLKLDDAHGFAQDTSKILALGEQLQRAQSLEDLDKVALTDFKSYQGQQAAEKVLEVHRGRLAQKRLNNFGQSFDTAVQNFTLANGRPPTDQERRTLSSETFMRVDPEAWSKSVLPRQITADAAEATAQTRAESIAKAAAAKTPANLRSDEELLGLGFTPEDIARLRKGTVKASVDINPLSRSIDRYNEERKNPNSTPEDLKLRQQLLASFARQRGEQVSFDDAGNPSIVQGVSPALRTKLESGINASRTALQFLDKLTPEKLDSAFGMGAALLDIGQSVGGANVGLGRTTDMTYVFQNIEAIKPLVRAAIQDEKGATTEGDVARASALIGGDFKRNSPEQAKQMVDELRTIFKQAMDRQAGAIAKAPSVQKEQTDSGGGFVEMVDTKGNKVRVPINRKAELRGKGYK